MDGIREFAGSGGESKYWSDYTAPLGIGVAMLLISCLKNFSILVKLNTLGLFCVMYILGFMFVDAVAIQGIDSSLPPLFRTK